MKKILLFAFILTLSTQLIAQRPGGPPPSGGQRSEGAAPQSNAINKEAESALKTYEKTKADVTGKKAQDAASWVKFGNAVLAVFDHPSKNIWVGLSALEARVVLKDQRSTGTESKTIGGEEYEVVRYPDKELYYDASGSLAFWVVTKPLMPQDLLNEALDAFKKAYELDAKGSQKKGITEGITTIQNRYISEAMTANSVGDHSLSSKNFGYALLCGEHPTINKVDTVVVFYTGLTAFYAQEFERARTYLERSLNLDFTQEGSVYSFLAECYKSLDQPEKVESILAQGFTKYPSNQGILVSLINMYRENNEDPEKVMSFIHKAQENEPTNESLYYAEGDIWMKLNNRDKALELFQKSIEINPKYMFGHFVIGTTYYDAAVDTQTLASEEMDDRKYNELLEERDMYLMKAIDPLEMAFALCDDEAIQTEIAFYLKNIYYRMQGMDEEKYGPLFEKYNDIVADRGR